MEGLIKLLSVAAGGAFGAVARHLVNVSQLSNVSDKFPVPTFVINIVGSFFLGFLYIVLDERFDGSEELRLGLTVGLLGAFTTFSTFELELYALMREGLFITAFAYLLSSIAIGFIGLIAGISLGRQL